MKAACKDRVAAVTGYAPKMAEVEMIESEIEFSMRTLSRANRASWRALSYAERVNAASMHAADRVLAEVSGSQDAALTEGSMGQLARGDWRKAVSLAMDDLTNEEIADRLETVSGSVRAMLKTRSDKVKKMESDGATVRGIARTMRISEPMVKFLLAREKGSKPVDPMTAKIYEKSIAYWNESDDQGYPRYSVKEVADKVAGDLDVNAGRVIGAMYRNDDGRMRRRGSGAGGRLTWAGQEDFRPTFSPRNIEQRRAQVKRWHTSLSPEGIAEKLGVPTMTVKNDLQFLGLKTMQSLGTEARRAAMPAAAAEEGATISSLARKFGISKGSIVRDLQELGLTVTKSKPGNKPGWRQHSMGQSNRRTDRSPLALTIRDAEITITRSTLPAERIIARQNKEWMHLPRNERRIGVKFLKLDDALFVWDANTSVDHGEVMRALGMDTREYESMRVDGSLGTATNIGEMREAIESLVDLGQAEDSGKRRGEFAYRDAIGEQREWTAIRLFSGRDESTILHEAGHWYLELVQSIARDAPPDAPIHGYLKEIRDWMGLAPGQRIEVRHHELWARTFEAYLREGVAPSLALVTPFRAFSRWLRKIYADLKRIVGEDGATTLLTPEAKSLFDRLLATEEEIAAMQNANKAVSDKMFATREESGMSEDKWRGYLAAIDNARAQSEDDLLASVMRAHYREQTLSWQRELARRRRTALLELRGQRGYRAKALLERGVWEDGAAGPDAATEADDVTDAEIDDAIEYGDDIETMGQWAGTYSKTANRSKLAGAKAAEAAGVSMGEILKAFGWYRAPTDGEWRYWISDKDVRFTFNQDTFVKIMDAAQLAWQRSGLTRANVRELLSYSASLNQRADFDMRVLLGDVISHSELFDAYPELRNVEVIFWDGYGPGNAAAIHHARGVNQIIIGRDDNMVRVMSGLIHELQHIIQYIELFHIGGASSHAAVFMDMLEPAKRKKLKADIRALGLDPDNDAVLYRFLSGEVEAFETQDTFLAQTSAENVLAREPALMRIAIPTIRMTQDDLDRAHKALDQRRRASALISNIEDYSEDMRGWAKKGNRAIAVTPEPGTDEYAQAVAEARATEPSQRTRLQRQLIAWESDSGGTMGQSAPARKFTVQNNMGEAVTMIHNPSREEVTRMTSPTLMQRANGARPFEYDSARWIADGKGGVYVAPSGVLHDKMAGALKSLGLLPEGYLFESGGREGHGAEVRTGAFRRIGDRFQATDNTFADVDDILWPQRSMGQSRQLDPMGFYSAVEQSALKVSDHTWGLGWKAARDAILKGADGVTPKRAEFDYVGLSELLDGTKARGEQLKQAVIEHIAANKLELIERFNRYDPSRSTKLDALTDKKNALWREIEPRWSEVNDLLGEANSARMIERNSMKAEYAGERLKEANDGKITAAKAQKQIEEYVAPRSSLNDDIERLKAEREELFGRIAERSSALDREFYSIADWPVDPNSAEAILHSLWDRMSTEVKSALRRNMPLMRRTDDGEFFVASKGRPGNDDKGVSLDSYEWDFKHDAKRNPLVAAYHIWVQGAMLWDEDGAFAELISAAGGDSGAINQALHDVIEKGDVAGAWVMQITPEMRAKITTQGFALFQSKPGAPDDPAIEPRPAGLKPIKLNRKVMRQLWREQAKKLRAAMADDGLHPDDAIEALRDMHAVFDYTSGDELVKELAALPRLKDAVEDHVQASLQSDGLSDPFLDGTVDELAKRAAHNMAAASKIEIELEAIGRATGNRVNVLIRAAKKLAEAHVDRMMVREVLNFEQYLRAERKAAKEAQDFYRDGKFPEAERAKSRQLMSFHIYRIARDRAERFEAGVRWTKKFDNEKTRKNYDNEARDQIDQLLVKFGISPELAPRIIGEQSLGEWMQTIEDMGMGHMLDIPGSIVAMPASELTKMPITDAEAVVDAIRNIDHIARNSKKLLDARNKATMSAAIDEMTTQIANHAPGGKARDKGALSALDKLDDFRELAHADHTKPEFLFRWLDGLEDAGPVQRYMFQPIARAEEAELDMSAVAAARLNKIFSVYTRIERGALMSKRISMPEFGKGYALTKSQIIALALNMGNEGNVKAVADGTGKSPEEIMDILDTHLTARDWNVVQSIWDWIGEYREPSFALQYELTGVMPAAVQATPVISKHGIFAGGYYPLKYDGAQSEKVNKRDEKIITLDAKGGNWIRPQTKKGHLQERVGSGGLPVKLDLMVMQEHVYNVIHDLTHRRALIDVYRMANHPKMIAAIKDAAGTQQYRQINAWLQNVAADVRDPSNAYQKVLSRLRTGSSVVNMGMKITTAIVQPLGMLGAVPRIGVIGLTKSMGRAASIDMQVIAQALPNQVRKFFGEPQVIPRRVQFALDKSAVLRYRMTTWDRDVRDALQSIKGRQDWDIVPIEVRRSFFWLTGIMDMGVSVPVWLTAYEQALGGKISNVKMGDDDAAVQHADSVIRMTQGSGSPKDLARLQRGGEGMRLFTQFYSYMSVLYNQLFGEQFPGAATGRIPRSSFVNATLFLWILPAILSEAIGGRLDAENGEDEDDRLKRVIMTVAAYPLSTIIGVRDLVSAVLSPYDYSITPVSDAMSTTADFVKLGGKVYEDGYIADDEWEKIGKKGVMTAGYWFALPTRQAVITLDYIADVFTGRAPGPMDDPGMFYEEGLMRDRQ